MGEIGVPRYDFLYVLRQWEIRAIIKGYRRRNREHWDMTRLLGVTFANVMGAKINSFSDFFPLPWDKSGVHEITEQEAKDLMALMERENAALQSSK